MREPNGAGGPGGGDVPPGDLPLRSGMALEGWRGWAGDVAVVLRRSWWAITAIMVVTMLLLSMLIADGVAMGTAFSPHGKGPLGLLVVTVFLAPVLLALAAGCGLVVARGTLEASRLAARLTLLAWLVVGGTESVKWRLYGKAAVVVQTISFSEAIKRAQQLNGFGSHSLVLIIG